MEMLNVKEEESQLAIETRLKWEKILLKAWSDKEFKKKLLSDPKNVLKENGIEFSEGQFHILEDSHSLRHLVLLTKPLNDSKDCCSLCFHYQHFKN